MPTINRLKAPAYLDRREKTLFQKITADHLPDYFMQSDMQLLAEYVEAHFIAREASVHLKEEGYVIPGQRGAMVTNPWQRVKRDAVATMASLATKLKLCPSGRIRAEDASRSIKKVRNGQDYNPGADWRDYQIPV